jgi:hypothetical protein
MKLPRRIAKTTVKSSRYIAGTSAKLSWRVASKTTKSSWRAVVKASKKRHKTRKRKSRTNPKRQTQFASPGLNWTNFISFGLIGIVFGLALLFDREMDTARHVCGAVLVMLSIASFARAYKILLDRTTYSGDPSTAKGSVYIVRSGNHYKIGHTTGDVHKRVASLQTGAPTKHELVHVIYTSNPTGLEKHLHHLYSRERGEGEWFRLSRNDVRAIKQTQWEKR